MAIERGTQELPVVFTVEHASFDMHEFGDRSALLSDLTERFSDYGTSDTVPRNGIAVVLSEQSRALVDLNRSIGAPDIFRTTDFADPQNSIWLPGKELTEREKRALLIRFYHPYHQSIVDTLKQYDTPTLLVSWHNTANKQVGIDENGKPAMMPSIILSNRGQKNTATQGDELITCNPELLESLACELAVELGRLGLANDVRLNIFFKGGYATQRYSSFRNSGELKSLGIDAMVQSLQVEYNTLLTHDQDTLAPNEAAIIKLRNAFSTALAYTIKKVGLEQ